jgi:hypothetical protein
MEGKIIMSAFIELAKFCEEHPEIRAHKQIGTLLQELYVELSEYKQDHIDNLNLRIQVSDLDAYCTKLREVIDNAMPVIEYYVGNGNSVEPGKKWLESIKEIK